MKLLAINGSHKKAGGINQLLIDHLFKGASEAGAVCETIRLSKLNLKPCIACNHCQNQKEYTCIHDDKDDFLSIISKIKESDIIIYSTPIYIFNVSGLFKIFFDRLYSRGKSNIKSFTKSFLLFHDVEKDLCSKPFVSIIVSDNIEKETTKNAISYFKSFSKFFDARCIASIVRNGSFIFKTDENKNKFKKNIDTILCNLEFAGKSLVINNSIPSRTLKRINEKVIPIPIFIFSIMKRFPFGQNKLFEKMK